MRSGGNCNPRNTAWQRGTNENTNGLLRQYFPKGTNFQCVSEEYLAIIVKKLNNRPSVLSLTLLYTQERKEFPVARHHGMTVIPYLEEAERLEGETGMSEVPHPCGASLPV
jgi:hypothetical protein